MLGCVTFIRLKGIKLYWKLQFLECLRTLSLKFQKAQTKIEVVLTLPWDIQQGRVRTTSILVRALWNFKLKGLRYCRNCSLDTKLLTPPKCMYCVLSITYLRPFFVIPTYFDCCTYPDMYLYFRFTSHV